MSAKRRSITFRSEDAASPQRVQAIVRILAEAAKESGDVSGSHFTLVVRNYRLRASLKAQDPVGDELASVIQETATNAQFASNHKGIAQAFARLDPDMFPGGLQLTCGKRKTITIDGAFVRRMKTSAAEAPAIVRTVRGTTTAHALILRVGRQSSDSKPQVNLLLSSEDEPREIAIDNSDTESLLFDIGKKHGWARLEIDALWSRSGGGGLTLEWKRSLVTHATEWTPASGAEFHRLAREAAPSLANLADAPAVDGVTE